MVSVDELPATVKSLNDSWLSTYQSSTVVVRRFYPDHGGAPSDEVLPGRAICNRRGQPSHLRQKRGEFPQKRRTQLNARAPDIYLSRAVLLHQRGSQRAHSHG